MLHTFMTLSVHDILTETCIQEMETNGIPFNNLNYAARGEIYQDKPPQA